jgi:DNA-binding beta-propeller fold protein YncE
MRREAIAVVIAVLVVAGLGVGYLAVSSAIRTETSSAFTYRTVTSTTIYSTNTTTVNSTTITETVASVSSSTFVTTWTRGQPIPLAMVETSNITIGGYQGIAIDQHSGRVYIAGGSHLLVIDASSHSLVANITLPGTALGGIAANDNTGVVYVSVKGQVAEISASIDSVVKAYSLDVSGPLAYNPSADIIYGYSAAHPNFLLAADAGTGSLIANISAGPAGWSGTDVSVNPKNGMVYAVGCRIEGLVCGGPVSVINGTSETVANTIDLNTGSYPTVAVNPETNFAYVTGLGVGALSGANLDSAFRLDPAACGPIDQLAVIPSSNQVAMIPRFTGYLLVYDGVLGNLVNMYSLPSSDSTYPSYVAFDPITNEWYVATNAGQLISFHNVTATGNMNSALIKSENCPLP